MRRWIVTLALISASCSGAGSTPPTSPVVTSGAPTTQVAAATAAPTTTSPGPATTLGATTTSPAPAVTTQPPVSIGTPIPLVVAAAGMLVSLTPDGGPVELYPTEAWRAFDDGSGGVIFQEPGFFESKTIRWIPAGDGEPRDILVPSEGHQIQLWGVDEPTKSIIYVRWEGDTPETVAATLRTFGLEEREVVNHAQIGAWESGPISISHWDGVFVIQGGGEGWVGVQSFDTAGDRDYDLSPVMPEHFAERTWEFPAIDGDRIAYIEWRGLPEDGADFDLVLLDPTTLDELDRLTVERTSEAWPVSMEYAHPYVVINREAPSEGSAPALVVDIERSQIWEVPFAGWADAVGGEPIDIAGT